MIKVIEGKSASNKALKGLAVTVTFQAGENVQTEFGAVKEALLNWWRSHGEACAALELEYRAGEDSWSQIEQFWVARLDTDESIRSLFEKLGDVDLCLLNPTGNNIKRIGFELGEK
jgi:hypothetical protein